MRGLGEGQDTRMAGNGMPKTEYPPAEPNANIEPNSNIEPNTNIEPNANIEPKADAYAEPKSDADPNANANIDSNANPNAEASANAKPSANAEPNANANAEPSAEPNIGRSIWAGEVMEGDALEEGREFTLEVDNVRDYHLLSSLYKVLNQFDSLVANRALLGHLEELSISMRSHPLCQSHSHALLIQV